MAPALRGPRSPRSAPAPGVRRRRCFVPACSPHCVRRQRWHNDQIPPWRDIYSNFRKLLMCMATNPRDSCGPQQLSNSCSGLIWPKLCPNPRHCSIQLLVGRLGGGSFGCPRGGHMTSSKPLSCGGFGGCHGRGGPQGRTGLPTICAAAPAPSVSATSVGRARRRRKDACQNLPSVGQHRRRISQVRQMSVDIDQSLAFFGGIRLTLADVGRALVEFGRRQTSSNPYRNCVDVGQVWHSFGRWLPKCGQRRSMLVELGLVVADFGQHRPKLSQYRPMLVNIYQLWVGFGDLARLSSKSAGLGPSGCKLVGSGQQSATCVRTCLNLADFAHKFGRRCPHGRFWDDFG